MLWILCFETHSECFVPFGCVCECSNSYSYIYIYIQNKIEVCILFFYKRPYIGCSVSCSPALMAWESVQGGLSTVPYGITVSNNPFNLCMLHQLLTKEKPKTQMTWILFEWNVIEISLPSSQKRKNRKNHYPDDKKW